MYKKSFFIFSLIVFTFGAAGTAWADPTPSCVLTSDKSEVVRGRWVQLSWEIIGTGGYSTQIEGWNGSFPSTQDHVIFTPKMSQTYRLFVINNWGKTSCETHIEVIEQEPINVVVTTDPETPKAPSMGRKLVQLGSSGSEVRILQGLLREHTNLTIAVDGIFGPLTKEAVIKYQTNHGLKIDGIVGTETWAKLQSKSIL